MNTINIERAQNEQVQENNMRTNGGSTAAFERRWFMCDYARQRTFVREEFILWLDALKRLGYNGLGMYIEGAFEFESIPGVLREGVITPEDAKWILEEGRKRDIYIFPMTNVVGHMEHFFRQERFGDMMMDGYEMQMNFLADGAEEFVMNIVHEYCRHFECKMIHIGGDETRLTEETKMKYAEFLAKICKNLLDEGIQPAIWDDMIWMDQEMVKVFDRRTFIFDWNYYGHRPESIEYFRNEGFTDIVVCPCDNSWQNFITHQHLSGYLRARKDIPLQPDEVEAFFEDARNAELYGGLLTNWNNETGRNMWMQWVTFARGGLYMSGKLDARERNDELIEMSLFGRITPYTEITYAIQNEIQGDDRVWSWFGPMRSSLFSPKTIITLYEKLKANREDFFYGFLPVIDKLEEKLHTWIPEGEFEVNCFNAVASTLEIIRASVFIMKALDAKKLYRRAAEVQFESPDSASMLLDRVAGEFRAAANEVSTAAALHATAIRPIGHTTNDLLRMQEVSNVLDDIADTIDASNEAVSRIPLHRFDRVLDHAVNGTFLYL